MNSHKSLIIVGVVIAILSTLFILNLNKNEKQTEIVKTTEIMNNFLITVPDWCLGRTSQVNQNWSTLQEGQFKISYPGNFKVVDQSYNFAKFKSTDKEVEFEVMSPLWTTGVQELISKSNKNFNVIDKVSKNKSLSCNTEVGENAVQTNTVYLLDSKDGAKKSLVIEVSLNDSQTESETNRFFALKVNEDDNFLNYKDKLIKFISSLEQFADA